MSATTAPTKVRVELGARSYDILIGRNLIATAAQHILPVLSKKHVVIVTDANVAKLHLEGLEHALTQAGKEYRVGLIRTSQLIDAEEDFENASLALIQAAYDQRRAAIELLKATGNLTPQSVQ